MQPWASQEAIRWAREGWREAAYHQVRRQLGPTSNDLDTSDTTDSVPMMQRLPAPHENLRHEHRRGFHAARRVEPPIRLPSSGSQNQSPRASRRQPPYPPS